jgi:hypothetical protein
VVTKAETLESRSRDLQEGEDVAAVLLSADNPRITEKAAEVVRWHSKAPVILFQRSPANIDESMFDHVYQGFVTPEIWLSKTLELIAQSIDLRERSARLGLEAQAARQETRRQGKQLRTELVLNKPSHP